MSEKKWSAFVVAILAIFLAGIAVGLFFDDEFLTKPSVPEQVAEPDSVVTELATANEPKSKSQYFYDSSALIRSFEPWMIFTENFRASHDDPAFTGNYQLAYPLDYPLDKLTDSKFDKLLLSILFGKDAPRKVDRKSIQAALDRVMMRDLKTTQRWWNEAKAEYGKNWRDEVCGCTGYFYAMPIEKTFRWMSFQQVSDYRCGGNGGPDEKYYTIVKSADPYVMDTSAFVPGFREKLVEMITDNVIYNFYLRGTSNREIDRNGVREATVQQFQGNFTPTLTLSGVKFVFGTWALPGTCHADGQIPVIVPYRMIQEIFTQKFKDDIGL